MHGATRYGHLTAGAGRRRLVGPDQTIASFAAIGEAIGEAIVEAIVAVIVEVLWLGGKIDEHGVYGLPGLLLRKRAGGQSRAGFGVLNANELV